MRNITPQVFILKLRHKGVSDIYSAVAFQENGRIFKRCLIYLTYDYTAFEFYVIAVSDREQTVERILIIPTDGLPDDREKQVISSVVNDRDCFYRYIAFLLGDDSILSMLEINNAGVEADDTMSRQVYHAGAIRKNAADRGSESGEVQRD